MNGQSIFKESGTDSKLLWLTSGTGYADERKANDRRRKYMMATLFSFMTLLALLLVLFKMRASSSEEDNEEDSMPYVPLEDVGIKVLVNTRMTTKTTPKATTTSMTTSSRTTATTTGNTMSAQASSSDESNQGVFVTYVPTEDVGIKVPVTTRTTVRTTTKATTPSTTTTTTSLTTTTTLTTTSTRTTAMTTGTTISARKRLDAMTLLCTFGLGIRVGTPFPSDGLCNFIFFDSAYSGGLNQLGNENTLRDNFKTFLAKVPHYNQTEFGIGLCSDHLGEIEADLQRTKPVIIPSYWKKGIFHFGVINIPVLNTNQQTLSRTFIVLEALGKFADEQKKVGRPSYVVMGTVPLDVTGITERMSKVYEPDLFIGHGHYPYLDQTRPSCLIMPPTTIYRESPTNADYPYDLVTTVWNMWKLARLVAKPHWMLSVTMKGRWGIAMLPSHKPLIGDMCVYRDGTSDFSSYREVCNHKVYSANLKYDNRYDVMYMDDGNNVFSYDNEVSFTAKLCSVKAKNTVFRFGIAAYDLEYDDYNGTCTKQNKLQHGYSRLRSLRRIVDYFETFTKGDRKDGCLKLFPKE